MINKNDEFDLEIVDNGVEGEGIAKKDGMTIFVPEAIKGEKVRVKILKVNKSICYAKLLKIYESSCYRVEADCKTYPKCGGCNFRHISYEYSLEMKKESVQNTLKKALGREILVDEVLGMDEPYYYRNKLQYPVRSK